MSSDFKATPGATVNKLHEVSKTVNLSSTIKMSMQSNPGTNPTPFAKPIPFANQKLKTELNTSEIQDDIIYEGDGKREFKNETFDYGTSEYIEDETGFEDISYPEMQIDESVGYEYEGYAQQIHYTDVIEDDLYDVDEDSKDEDPDFGQKKKKKKKIPNNAILNRDDPSKKVKMKPKILECTDDLTKIDHCEDNPNFAVVVDFIEKFGEHLGLKRIPIKELQSMLSDHENEPHIDLIKLHTNLLRKTKLPKKTLITKKTWENALILFCQSTGGMVGEGLELQKLGYTQISLSLRLEILKNLMESQFDWNERIRMLVDDLPVEALRHEPTGKDIEGKIYWTQIDDHAEIRIYTEDYRHDTWGNVVQNRVELVSLLDKLKDEKLYKLEVEKLKVFEADVQDQNALVDVIVEMEKAQEEKAEVFNTDYRCEVCKLELGTKLALMEHYSGGHMAEKLKEKFKHLVEKGQCKICKFEAEEENLIWIHIGTLHGKVNPVLKENKLKPIGDKVKDSNDEKTNPEININSKQDPNIIQTEDIAVIKKLEKKIEELKYQMCDSEIDNHSMTDLSTSSHVQNNQQSEEVLSRENFNMMEGVEIRKVNSVLNLDGITELDEDEAKIEEQNEPVEENAASNKTTKGRRGRNAKEKITEKEDSKDAGIKGNRGRKRKADTQTVPNAEDESNSVETKMEGNEINPEDKSKVTDASTSKKQKETKGKTNDENSDSVERPRRGRACREIADIIKAANTPIKKGKVKTEAKKSEEKEQTENNEEKEVIKATNTPNKKGKDKTEAKKLEEKGQTENNEEQGVIKAANTPIKKGKDKTEAKKSEEKGQTEDNEEKELIKAANTPIKKGKDKTEAKKSEEKEPTENNQENDLKEEKSEKNKRNKNKKDEPKNDGNTKEVNKKDGNKKGGNKNKKDDNKEVGEVGSKEPNENIDLKIEKDEKNEKKKRGKTTTPKKGNKSTVIDTTSQATIEQDVNVEEIIKDEETKDVKNQNKKRNQRSPVKKLKNASPEKLEKGDSEVVINASQIEDVPQNIAPKEENNSPEKMSKGSQSKKTAPKKTPKETNNKKNKKKDEKTENEDQTDIKAETKTQGKRKETGDETEKQTKKKKIEEPIQTSKNVRERKGRNVKKPMYEDPEEDPDEDLNEENDIQTEKSTKTSKEKKGKNIPKISEGDIKNIKAEDNDPKTKIKKTRKRKGKEDKKVIDVAKEMKVKERKENKLSCKKCNQWKDGKESVFACSNCEQGWHQHCAIPPLYHEPEADWLCPLCHHVALVKKLEKTLAEFDILMERAEERRLADLIENQSRVTDDQYDDLNDYSYSGAAVRINVQVKPPEIKDIMRPDYYESSDEDARESDDDEWGVKRTAACTCEGDGDCLFCKRMQGCTCDGHGTCRLCMSKTDKSSSKPGAPKGTPKMSTTEMFLLTGKTRQVEVQAHEHAPDNGFRYRGTARGRAMPRRMRRGRGGRGMSMGRGQPPTLQPPTLQPPALSIGKSLPPGITIISTTPEVSPERKPFAGLGIGRSLPPGITVMNSSGKDVTTVSPKARAPVPELNLPGISISRPSQPPAKVIDVIDLSDSDDEPVVETIIPKNSVVPYQPARPYGAVQGGRMQMQPGMRRPMQQRGMMRPRMPMQQGGKIIVQSGQRGLVQRGGIQSSGFPLQRGNMAPRRAAPLQRGGNPMQRPQRPGFSGQRPMVRGGYPTQRPGMPGSMRPRGPFPIRRGGPPIQRGFGAPQRPGMPPRRPMMRRPMGRVMPGGMRPRMPMVRGRPMPGRGGMMRGQRPMMRMRGRPMPGRGGPRPILNNQSPGHPDIVIPTVTPGYNSSPDMDIIADNAEIPNYDGQDDGNYRSPLPSKRGGLDANLARLPQFIQIQKVVEHEVLDLE